MVVGRDISGNARLLEIRIRGIRVAARPVIAIGQLNVVQAGFWSQLRTYFAT